MEADTIYSKARLIILIDGTKLWVGTVFVKPGPPDYQMHYGMAPSALDGKPVLSFDSSNESPMT